VPSADNTFVAKVDVKEPLGPEYVVYLKTDAFNLLATVDNSTKLEIDDTAEFVVRLQDLHIFDAETEEAIR